MSEKSELPRAMPVPIVAQIGESGREQFGLSDRGREA
jgi:hypothetical protein